MCVLPKAPKVPLLAERQAVQAPVQMAGGKGGLNQRRRRGLFASIMTSAQGATGPISVTGTPGA